MLLEYSPVTGPPPIETTLTVAEKASPSTEQAPAGSLAPTAYEPEAPLAAGPMAQSGTNWGGYK